MKLLNQCKKFSLEEKINFLMES